MNFLSKGFFSEVVPQVNEIYGLAGWYERDLFFRLRSEPSVLLFSFLYIPLYYLKMESPPGVYEIHLE